MEIARFIVRGRVQGVGFRYFVRTRCRAVGLAGWVRNHDDGSVEALVAGPERALSDFERELRQGPPGARVESVSREPVEAEGPLPVPFDVVR